MSVPKDIKRVLFPIQTAQKNNQGSHPDQQDSIFTALKETIHTQQKERIKGKYERNLKNKQIQLLQLGKKYNLLEEQLKKITIANKKITQEKEISQQQINKKQKQLQEKEFKLVKKYNIQIQNQQQQICLLKASNKKLSDELVSVREKLISLQKQHKITMRRCNTTLQQTRTQLQSKLSIKQKQQQKIQALFEQKKHQFNLRIDQKEEEITCMLKDHQSVKADNDRLQTQLASFQKEKMNDFREFEKEVKVMEEIITQVQDTHKSFVKNITDCLLTFKAELGLTSQDEDLMKLVGKMQEELLSRKDLKQYEDAIAKYQQQAKTLQQTEKDLNNKINILQEEIAFMRNQNTSSQEFAALVKSHMQDIDDRIAVDKKQRIVKQSQALEKQKTTPAVPLQSLHSHQKIPKNIEIQLKYPKQRPAEKSIEVCLTKSKGKTTNDFLKEELQSKKKSLIYLMYRPSEDKQNENPAPASAKKQNPSPTETAPTRRRSNSLGNIISARCREQIN